MKNKKHIQSFNEHQENLNISDVSDSKINEGTMGILGIDFAKLAEDYLKSGDAFTVHALGIRDFAKWLNDNLAL
jgi:hypothetical protein